MKTEDMNTIMKQFDSIKNITPSENWDGAFENKLNKARMTKSNTVAKFNAIMLVLVMVNIGFFWNASKTEDRKSVDSRNSNFKTIADQLFIPNN